MIWPEVTVPYSGAIVLVLSADAAYNLTADALVRLCKLGGTADGTAIHGEEYPCQKRFPSRCCT